ncbi:MAG: Cof-type HAD-IIB family hydrolase [Clostridia bacterium]|nr:Cof-type HAD-IIB family hydrolase [Clostridia bacterium]
MGYRLIASDLDGTLLSDNAEVTKENFDAIRRITEAGVLFVPVTGRAMYEMPRNVVECENIRYTVSSNGAVIYDKVTGEKITHCFTVERFREIFMLLKKYQVTMTIHYDQKSITDASKVSDEAFDYYCVNDYYRKHIRTTNVMIDNFDEYFSEDREAEMLSIFFRYEEELQQCYKELEAMGDVDITASTKGNLEIIRRGALKGAALMKLAEKLSIPLSEVIAVGDSRNDLSMIEIAGLGLAASNAIDVVKDASDAVICSNNENVAVHILDNYIR